jgi:tRNA (mo5U34)-methyltransferase
MRGIWDQANEFRNRLRTVKHATALERGAWYPYDSLAPMEILDEFLDGDPSRLLEIIGGKLVLDLGCGDGDLSFFLASLGAEVEAIDHAATNYNKMAGVNALKQALGASSVRIRAADLDQPVELCAPVYGLGLLMGVLYHLKNPYSILETLAHKARYCFLSTRIAALAADRKTRIANIPVAYLLGEGEANQDNTNFWIFSEAGLRRIISRSGWNILKFRTTSNAASSDPASKAGDARAYCLIQSRVPQAPAGIRLLDGWHAIEFGAWRWTERRFSFAIDDSVEGRTVRLRFYLAPVVFAGRAFVTLRAGEAPPQTYTTPGEHAYECPAASHVHFELDTAIGPTKEDPRELGLQVEFSEEPPITLL